MERTYEYKLKGTQQWIEVPAGSAEITSLKAGDYDVRYGATDEYSASYNSKTFTILDPVTRSIKVADSLPDDIKNTIEIPSSANAGSTVTLKMKFSELTFVEEIIVTATKILVVGLAKLIHVCFHKVNRHLKSMTAIIMRSALHCLTENVRSLP